MATLYGATGGSSNSDLYTIDPVTGAWTSVGPIGFAVTGLAFDPTTGILYGSTSNNSALHKRSLITIDPVTGAGTFIGAFAIGTATMADLAFKSDGTLYGLSTSAELYTVDLATGTATDVGDPGFSGAGLGFEIDADDNGYAFPSSPDGGPFYQVDLSTGAATQIDTFQNGDDFPFVDDAIAAASFDESGVLWLLMNNFGSATDNGLATVDNTGTFLASLGSGIQNGDALAWQGSVKPDPWFVFPVYEEDFDTAPVPDATCSAPGALVSTDGAAQGPSSLKSDAALQDSWIELPLTIAPVTTFDASYFYTSFALYVPSWADLWDSGAAWAPTILSLSAGSPNNQFFCYLIPTSSTTGVIETIHGNDSTAVPDGTWCAVEVAYSRNGLGSNAASRIWIDNVDSGVMNESSPLNILGITLGDESWGGPPPTDTNMTFYIDEFKWSKARIGPADLSAAFFNGAGSGTDVDACTGDPVTAHPVDDAYSVDSPHTLNVPAPGVMSNDILPTTVSLNTGPSHGSLTLNSDGSFSYTPDPSYLGDDSWVYNGNGGTATVTITVQQAIAKGLFDGGPVHQAAR